MKLKDISENESTDYLAPMLTGSTLEAFASLPTDCNTYSELATNNLIELKNYFY